MFVAGAAIVLAAAFFVYSAAHLEAKLQRLAEEGGDDGRASRPLDAHEVASGMRG